MADSLAGLALAAGAGTRLWPLTARLPKALCPVGDRPLLDHALARLGPVVAEVSVNIHHGSAAMQDHLDAYPRSVHRSLEGPVALGTAGAVGKLARWLDGRAVLVTNADTWHDADLRRFVDQWDRERVAVLTNTPGAFGARSGVVASLVPGSTAAGLTAEPSGLWETLWRGEAAAGRIQTVHTGAPVLDCGTHIRYLEANLLWVELHAGQLTDSNWVHPGAMLTGSAQGSVIGRGASVAGRIRRCVVWPGSEVGDSEMLTDTVRAGDLTVMVRAAPR
jgi:mannose-1-phosphate guanylyltransferase/MurNAc alpha-1-phosphate uridylyltransferase